MKNTSEISINEKTLFSANSFKQKKIFEEKFTQKKK